MSAGIARRVEILGGIVVVGAIVWWSLFFTQVADVTGDKPELIYQKTFMCIVYTTSPCAIVYGIAQLAGYTAYTPLAAWIGLGLLVASRGFGGRRRS
jgi:hypothetical protein